MDASPLLKPSHLLPHPTLHFPSSLYYTTNRKPTLFLTSKPPPPRRCLVTASSTDGSAATSEINMVKNRQGLYTPRREKVVVLWDLDNKPPRGPPYTAAMALKQVAQRFGEVIDMCAYANRHAFIHLPQWVLEERRDRRQMDILERKGVVAPAEPYICGVCGRKCKTNLDLKKHFKQLHERERQKKISRMRSLKGKKRQRYKERFISGNHKYDEEARRLLTPKVGYGLASELRRAGVFVKTVEDKPQAADWAMKRQIEHSMSRGIDWLFLVSDDSDFSEILRRAREANLGTVVVGDRDGALGRHADLWVPWIGVENGEVTEKDLVPRSRNRSQDFERDDELFSVSGLSEDVYEERDDLDNIVNEIFSLRSELKSGRMSAFSEEEEEDDREYLLWDREEGEFHVEDEDF